MDMYMPMYMHMHMHMHMHMYMCMCMYMLYITSSQPLIGPQYDSRLFQKLACATVR
jgi:hypothetical protein